MGKLSTLLFGAAVGAGLMYFMDPAQGNRRKAMIRDRFNSLPADAANGLDKAANDLRQRVGGVLSEGAAMMGDPGTADQLLTERVRSHLGFLTRHPGAVQVNVQNKTAVVSGNILADEVENLLAGVQKVRGVMSVENRLQVHQQAGNIPQLQGEGSLPGQQSEWSPGIRLLAGTGAIYLYFYGMIRGGFFGTLAQAGGIALGARTLTNKGLKSLTGLAGDGTNIQVRKTISIQAPVEQVYDLWSNFENFPRFMENIESIRDLGDGRSHWVVKGPAGKKVEFDAITTQDRPNEMIAWETVEDSTVKHHGQVRFKNQQDRTQVNVNMVYTPPGGVVGHTVASIFGVDPKSSMDGDLARMKSLLEEGKTSVKGEKVTQDKVMQGSANRSRGQIPKTGDQPSDKPNQGQEPQKNQDQGSGVIPQTGNSPDMDMGGINDQQNDLDDDDDILLIEEISIIPTTGMGVEDVDLDESDLSVEEDEENDMGEDETNSDPLRNV